MKKINGKYYGVSTDINNVSDAKDLDIFNCLDTGVQYRYFDGKWYKQPISWVDSDDMESGSGGSGGSSPLPSVNSTDNGKVLTVVNGIWNKAVPSVVPIAIANLSYSMDDHEYSIDMSYEDLVSVFDAGGLVAITIAGGLYALAGYNGDEIAAVLTAYMPNDNALNGITVIITSDAVNVSDDWVPLSDGGGGSSSSMVVHVTYDVEDGYTSDVTFEDIVSAIQSENVVTAELEVDGRQTEFFSISSMTSEGVIFTRTVAFISGAGPGVYYKELLIQDDNNIYVDEFQWDATDTGGGGGGGDEISV